jgi:hypothetical protein
MQSLCIPCACRCRYCLLSWDGKPVGVSWERGAAFARRFKAWLSEHRPELPFHFSFGYSMEHPRLREALRLLREIGSPQAEFLQCDGLRMRDRAECETLTRMLAEEGVKSLNFTFYGLREYHNRFAARPGDFDLMLRMMDAAASAGLSVSAGIPLTAESAPQADALIDALRKNAPCERVFLVVPHEEGRGVSLRAVRFSEDDLEKLSPDARALLNRTIYRPEREWLEAGALVPETKRTLILSLRGDNIERYEAMTPGELIDEAEALDDAYYAAFPTLPELARRYGDINGRRFYSRRDLFFHYRRLFAAEHPVSVYDVTDERQTGSRRA